MTPYTYIHIFLALTINGYKNQPSAVELETLLPKPAPIDRPLPGQCPWTQPMPKKLIRGGSCSTLQSSAIRVTVPAFLDTDNAVWANAGRLPIRLYCNYRPDGYTEIGLTCP